MSSRLKFYVNLALLGFAVGRSYAALRKRPVQQRQEFGRRRWN
jgi:hypothetical protein